MPTTTNKASTATNKRANILLITGALIGFILAASGLLEPNKILPNKTVATVNGAAIAKDDYLSYVNLLARDKRNPLTAADHRHILNRMIEEKLLVERGIAIGLAETDPLVRKTISRSLIETVTTDAASYEASDKQLADFYQQNLHYFAKPARLQVQRIVFRGEQAASHAQAAHQALQQGHAFAQVKKQWGSRDIITLPNSLLPANKLRQYLGPKLTEQALSLQPQQFSAPIAASNGQSFSLLYVLHSEASQPQAFAAVRELVASEYRRRAGDDMLKAYLQQLRAQADINIDEIFLDSLNTLSANNTPAAP